MSQFASQKKARPSGILTINDNSADDFDCIGSPTYRRPSDYNPNLMTYSPEELQTILIDATTKFNIKPKSAREFLISKGIIHGTAEEMATFIVNNSNKLSKRRIGEYIGNMEEYNQHVCVALFQTFNFQNKPLDTALRYLLLQFRLPGEAQQIDRILEKFARVYYQQNPDHYASSDIAYILSFSIIMLNTDLHNNSIAPDKKMTLDQFIRNNRGINQGEDIERSVLEELYNSVKNDEIKMEAGDMYDSEVVTFMAPTKSGWLLKKTESILGHWNKHWFVLNDGCLYYFTDPSDENPRCIIPLDHTLIGRGSNDLDFVITSAVGTYVKSSKRLDGGGMEQGKHPQFELRCESLEDREAWVKSLQEEIIRFIPLHEIFLKRLEEKSPGERPLPVPDQPIAEGWMRKRGGVNPSWKRRYFVLYCDFDGGGNTLFYYLNQKNALKMKALGKETQQGYIRMRTVLSMEIKNPGDGQNPYIEVSTDDRLWSFAPDDQEHLNYWFDALLIALQPYQPTELIRK